MLLGLTSFCLGGEQTIKVGAGYKDYKAGGHNLVFHAGRYFYGGYGYSFGKNLSHKFQFQVANSNREVEYELPYVTANTNIDITQEFNFNIYNKGKFQFKAGGFIGNSLSLNFFPIIDTENFIWENLMMTGISSQSNYTLDSKNKILFNFQIPIYSYFLSHRFDRFDGEAPETTLDTWEIMDKQNGFANKLFKPTFELGYEHNVFSKSKFGIFYQGEYNWYSRGSGFRTRANAHSLSLRISY